MGNRILFKSADGEELPYFEKLQRLPASMWIKVKVKASVASKKNGQDQLH
jgi:hypothetical protein